MDEEDHTILQIRLFLQRFSINLSRHHVSVEISCLTLHLGYVNGAKFRIIVCKSDIQRIISSFWNIFLCTRCIFMSNCLSFLLSRGYPKVTNNKTANYCVTRRTKLFIKYSIHSRKIPNTWSEQTSNKSAFQVKVFLWWALVSNHTELSAWKTLTIDCMEDYIKQLLSYFFILKYLYMEQYLNS